MDPLLVTSLEIGLAAALPFGVEKAIRWYRQRKSLEYLSCVFPISDKDRSMTVKCSIWKTMGGTNPETFRGYVHSAEALALKNLASRLEPLDVKLDLHSFYGPPTGATKLVLIGSGANNDSSKAILNEKRRLGKYSFVSPRDEHFYFALPEQPELALFKCEHQRNSQGQLQVRTDYGLIVRKRVDAQDTLLLAGIHMHGTFGAAKVALSNEFQAEVKRNKLRSFAQLVKVEVEEEFGLDIRSVSWKQYPLSRIDEG